MVFLLGVSIPLSGAVLQAWHDEDCGSDCPCQACYPTCLSRGPKTAHLSMPHQSEPGSNHCLHRSWGNQESSCICCHSFMHFYTNSRFRSQPVLLHMISHSHRTQHICREVAGSFTLHHKQLKLSSNDCMFACAATPDSPCPHMAATDCCNSNHPLTALFNVFRPEESALCTQAQHR